MLSFIITSYNEIQTTSKNLEVIIPQLARGNEIIVVSPNLELKEVLLNKCKVIDKGYLKPIFIQDPAKGKPYALSLAIQRASHNIVAATDGDVIIDKDSIASLIDPFKDPKVGLVSGHPISLESKDTMLGFWSHFLTDAADHIRTKRDKLEQFVTASGYLLAFRKSLVSKIPSTTLVDDAYISQLIAKQGYKTKYAKQAKVYVHFPKSYSDWLKQKLRSTGGYQEKLIQSSKFRMRSLKSEIIDGCKMLLKYPKSIKQGAFILLLILARVHLWGLIFYHFKLKKQSKNLWVRVESSKN